MNAGANDEIAPVELIRALAEPNALLRDSVATLLYSQGVFRALPVFLEWMQDADLGKMLLGTAGDVEAGPDTPSRLPFTVGVAVTPENFEKIRAAFGNPPLADVPADQDAREFALHVSTGVRLDILTTKAPGGGGALDKYLQKFGEGIQQVEYVVADVDRASQLLRERIGVKPVYAETRAGADGTRVNFFLVASPAGDKVLIELVEEGKSKK